MMQYVRNVTSAVFIGQCHSVFVREISMQTITEQLIIYH